MRDWMIVLLAVGGVVFLVTLVIVLVLAVRMLRLARVVHELPTAGKFAFYGSLLYAISPIDLLPDPILIDDIGVLAAALAYVGKLARTYTEARPGQAAASTQPRDASWTK